MSSEKEQAVQVKFIADEDVLYCGSLVAKNSRLIHQCKNGNLESSERFSSKISISDTSKESRVSRSSTCFPTTTTSERKRRSTRRSHLIAQKCSEVEKDETEMRTPKKRPRKHYFYEEFSSDEDKEEEDIMQTPQSCKSNAETYKRRSKRNELITQTRKASLRKSQSFTDASKSTRSIVKSSSKTASRKSTKFNELPLGDSIDGSSSERRNIRMKLQLDSNSEIDSKKMKSPVVMTPTLSSNLLSTPKSSKLKQPRTPATVRRKLTKEFASMNEKKKSDESDEELSSLSDFEELSDDFVPSSSDSESVEDENDNEGSKVVSSTQLSHIREGISDFSYNAHGRKKTIDVDFSYEVDADDYFLSKCSKNLTSNKKLSSLEVSHLGEDEIENLLKNDYTKHADIMASLTSTYAKEFSKWLFYLKENFNLVMYGLGSKMELLDYFHAAILSTNDVLTIHGYFHRLLVKDILDSLTTDILKIKAPKNMNEALPMIFTSLKSRKSPVFIIIHNIDRLLFRQRKYLSVLSKLASFPNIRLIASIDHINAALLWGNSMLTQLSFLWINVPTYQPYVNETRFDNLICMNETSSDFISLSSLRNILALLGRRVKRIFQIIAKNRLENSNNKQYKGMSYDEWYHRAKKDLLVNSTNVFNVQITELKDHGIIKMNDDHQYITLMIKLDVLEKFYKEMYENEE